MIRILVISAGREFEFPSMSEASAFVERNQLDGLAEIAAVWVAQ